MSCSLRTWHWNIMPAGITYLIVEWQLKASHGFEPRSLDTKSRMRTVTPPDQRSRRPAPYTHLIHRSHMRYWRHLTLCAIRPCFSLTFWRWVLRHIKNKVLLLLLQRTRKRRNLSSVSFPPTSMAHCGANMTLGYQAHVALHIEWPHHKQRPRADLNRDRWIQSPEC